VEQEELENSRALLQNREQLRRHWSGLIINLTGFLVVAVAAILSFITSYAFDNLDDFSKVYSALLITAGLCSTTVGFIRWYIRSIDNQIARIYPSILRYEQILGVPGDEGIIEYLLTHWGKDKKEKQELLTSFSNLNNDERVLVLKTLTDKKLLGGRGHEIIDLILLYAIGITTVVLAYLFICVAADIPTTLAVIGFLLMMLGLIVECLAYYNYQRNPQEEDIECAINTALSDRIAKTA